MTGKELLEALSKLTEGELQYTQIETETVEVITKWIKKDFKSSIDKALLLE